MKLQEVPAVPGLHASAAQLFQWATDNPGEPQAAEIAEQWRLYEDSGFENSGYAQNIVDVYQEAQSWDGQYPDGGGGGI